MTKASSDASFEKDVIKSSKPVLVDFWAEWCGPCRQLTPVLEDVSKHLSDKIEVIKINIDENPETPSKFGVRSIPTLMLFDKGKAVATKVGFTPKNSLVAWVEDNI
jgi:thioredoxin 1